jgi:crotonyl-CoA carboxylase/reductase
MSATVPPFSSLPQEMQAWVIREERHGDPADAMRLEWVTLPTIGPTEVLISVMAAGVNFNGLWACWGKPLSISQLKVVEGFLIPGTDAAGIVCQVGEAVKRWKPGDEVVVHGNVSCGQCTACNGLDPLYCEDQRAWGYQLNWGSFAPYAKAQAQQLMPKPAHLTWEEAATLNASLSTVYRMLVTRARIQAGENVLIWGGAGGLGVFAIQLCLAAGATPIAIVSSEAKAEFCRQLGCRLTLNRLQFDFSTLRGKQEFGRAIRSLTGGEDPDIIFEHTGKETFSTSVYVCKRFGRVVTCAGTTGYDVDFDVRYLWWNQKTILGSHGANLYEADLANRLVIERKIRPAVWKTLPFDQAPEAQAWQGHPEHMGKIALLVNAPTAGLGNKA